MRIQVDLPENRVSQIQELMRELGIETYKELFSNAISILDWMADEIRNGRVIASIDGNSHQRIPVSPVLRELSRAHQYSVPKEP